jgi:tetratricopeptide (TPR) repeat protein
VETKAGVATVSEISPKLIGRPPRCASVRDILAERAQTLVRFERIALALRTMTQDNRPILSTPMVCPRCGHAGHFNNGCPVCGMAPAQTTVATGVVAIDTTGLPAGATFGPTMDVSIDETTIAGTRAVDIGTNAGTGTRELAAATRAVGPLKVGHAFGPRYHVIKLLGVGGMGAVYQARDAELGVAVALKVIRSDRHGSRSAEAEKRFKTELLLARQVTHKHVVRIHDLGEIDGIKYITMPYVQGDDLGSLLRRDGKLPISRVMRLARQIADGLQAAHEAGVVHRDLKPANIMIGGSGDDEQALIMDFGISASTDENTAGTVVGTLEYMSPEQARGKGVDARSDLYAFGLIVYEMLAGPRPHLATGPERVTAMRQRFEKGVPPLATIDAAVPEPLAQVVARCMEGDPALRYQTTTELCAALAALDDAGELIPVPLRFGKRLVAAGAIMVLALMAGTWWISRTPALPTQHEPVSVLIADFENKAGDPVFEGAIEQALTVALEGASYITVFKTGDARAVAAQLSKGSDRITDEIGRLIARREGLKVLVEGVVERQGRGYRLDLRAIDAATGNTIATARQNIGDKAQVLSGVTGAAIDIRRALGESKSEMTKLAAAESFTAGSLEALRAYARGQELSRANKVPQAVDAYKQAIALDPQFGRAYAGLASIYSNYFKQPEQAEANYQLALKHLDRMSEREKYRTLGTYYLNIVRNYEKAIENYETLVKLYPADDVGHGNLALAYLLIGNVSRAVAEQRTSLAIYPRNSLQRYNYAMYLMYASDFSAATAEADRLIKENPAFEYPFVPLALSHLALGDEAGARDAYARLAALSPLGSSLANLGEADLEMRFGRARKAVALLTEGIAADRGRSGSARLAQKQVILAEGYAALGDQRRAADAAQQATSLNRREGTLFPAAMVLLHSNHGEAATAIASDLDKMLQRQTSAYAQLISGEAALERGRIVDAIEAFRAAIKRHDSWFGRFLLGRAYVEAGGHDAEALAELELCAKRQGETNDVFFYDMPTSRYLPPLYYWLGRAQEGLGAAADARKYYQEFLAIRGGADANPTDSLDLVLDARRRLDSIQ